MSLVTQERRGATQLITYANPPFGTMTAAGSNEMLAAVESAVADAGVRAIVLTGGLPGIFIRHYDVGELSDLGDLLAGARPAPAPDPSIPPPRPGGGLARWSKPSTPRPSR